MDSVSGDALYGVSGAAVPFLAPSVIIRGLSVLRGSGALLQSRCWSVCQSGFAEFARQWILLSRRSEFDSDTGVHELWMKAGGSAGHSRLWAVDINEGTMSSGFSGQTWKPLIRPLQQLKIEKAEQKEVQQQKKTGDAISKNVDKIIEVLSAKPDGETKSVIAKEAKLNSKNLNLALEAAITQGRVKECQVMKNGRSHDGYHILKDQSDTQTDSDRQ